MSREPSAMFRPRRVALGSAVGLVATLAASSGSPVQAAPRARANEPQSDRAAEHREPEQPDHAAQPLWSSLRAGYEFVDLTTFQAEENDFSADLVPTRANGPMGQLALGVRLLGFSFGARGTLFSLANVEGESGFQDAASWSLDAEIGLHIAATKNLDPFLLFDAGYTAIGGLELRGVSTRVRVRGYNVRVGFGIDYFVSTHWAVGALVTGEALFVTRPGVSAMDLLTPKQVETIGEAKARALEADGTSVGTAVAVAIGPSVHF